MNERAFEARCPLCRAPRPVHGAPADDLYPRDSSGARWRPCPACVPQGRGTPVRLTDRDWLARMYAVLSAQQIGRYVGCSGTTVGRWLRRHGIPVRTRSEATQMAWTTPSGMRAHGRNRQMVTGQGLSDTLPGSVKHFQP